MERLLPYLTQIDENRIYSNFGPLVQSLERRLAQRANLPSDNIVTVANATVGLTAVLQAISSTKGFCIIPAWTFVATAHAVVAAGMTPYLIDVEPTSWSISPRDILEVLPSIEGEVSAVMPVAPFGAFMDVEQWDQFSVDTGIPVVIDAAAGYDTAQSGQTPVVVSLHATKILGAGEGGYVACRQPGIITDVRKRINFGFYGTRESQVYASNSKMSEYHAAVGLASMEEYDETRASFIKIVQHYRQFLSKDERIIFQADFGTTWATSVCVVRLKGYKHRSVQGFLASKGIDTRSWWGAPICENPCFQVLKRARFPNAEMLSTETLGLPLFVDMTVEDVRYVSENLIAALDIVSEQSDVRHNGMVR